MPNILSEDWYEGLVEDLKAIMTEKRFRARIEVIEGAWEFGERIEKERENFKKWTLEEKGIVMRIANDTQVSAPHVYQCLKFYQKFPDLDKFLDKQDKALSWHKITQEFLPDKKRNVPDYGTCPKCQQKLKHPLAD